MRPKDISNAEAAFGTGDVDLLPPYDQIPKEFKEWNNKNKWGKIVDRWFFEGLPKGTKFNAKKGIDEKKAFKHIVAAMRSFASKHEHKTAGVAYLMSEWYEDIVIPEGEKK